MGNCDPQGLNGAEFISSPGLINGQILESKAVARGFNYALEDLLP